MTINERVSPETLDKIIEAADEVIAALAGTNEDVHKNDSAKMCQLWDDLNDRYATPAIVKALARELQQYRAAEPVTVVLSSRAGNDTSTIDKALPEGFKLYASPQVTSVPDGLTIAREIIKEAWRLIPQSDSVQSAEWHTAASMFLNDSTAAPAVQAEQTKRLIGWRTTDYTEETSDPEMAKNWAAAVGVLPIFEGDINTRLQAEQLSGNTEQVSQPYTLPADYLQGYKDGCEWSALMAEANHPQTGDWLFDDPIDLAKAIRKGPEMLTAEHGSSPVIPDGWIPVSERLPETDGNYWGWWSESKRQGPVWFIKSEIQAQFQSSEITHWMPLPNPPKQEAV